MVGKIPLLIASQHWREEEEEELKAEKIHHRLTVEFLTVEDNEIWYFVKVFRM